MVTLVLSRHGATDRSDPEQHLGQRIDIPLSDSGRSAAAEIGRRFQGVDFQRVISSPLIRAQETARLAAPNAAIETDGRLAEMDYGEWEGLTYAQIDERWADERRRWERDPEHNRCPGGESGDDVARRVRSFLEDLLHDADTVNARYLAVAHSTTNRILLCIALDVPIRAYRRRFRQDPANITVLRYSDADPASAQLLLANDTAHVEGIRGATWEN